MKWVPRQQALPVTSSLINSTGLSHINSRWEAELRARRCQDQLCTKAVTEQCVLHLQFCLMYTMMELFKRLLGVVLVCGVSAQQYWMQSPLPQKHLLLPTFQKPQQQSNVPPPAAPFHKCVLEEAEKIQCGTPGITVDQCRDINCCFDGHLCYYGKAGMYMSTTSLFFSFLHFCDINTHVLHFFLPSNCTVYLGWPVCGGCGQRSHSATPGCQLGQLAWAKWSFLWTSWWHLCLCHLSVSCDCMWNNT